MHFETFSRVVVVCQDLAILHNLNSGVDTFWCHKLVTPLEKNREVHM